MARPSFNCKWLLALVLPFVLSSCLELKVTATFKTATSGTVDVQALSYRMAKGLTWEGLTFPSTREEWTQLVLQSPGASLTSFETLPDDLGTRTHVVLAFSTSRALESLFVSFKQKLTLLQDTKGKYNLVLAPTVPKLSSAAADTRKLWIDLWGDVTWSFLFLPPGNPTGYAYAVNLRDLAAEKPLAEGKASW